MLDAFYIIAGADESENETQDEKSHAMGHTRPCEVVHWKLNINMSEVRRCRWILDGKHSRSKWSRLTNQQMSSEDEEVLEESKDIQGESDLYFGNEKLPDYEEQVYAKEDQSRSDLVEESEYEGDQNDSDFEID